MIRKDGVSSDHAMQEQSELHDSVKNQCVIETLLPKNKKNTVHQTMKSSGTYNKNVHTHGFKLNSEE